MVFALSDDDAAVLKGFLAWVIPHHQLVVGTLLNIAGTQVVVLAEQIP